MTIHPLCFFVWVYPMNYDHTFTFSEQSRLVSLYMQMFPTHTAVMLIPMLPSFRNVIRPRKWLTIFCNSTAWKSTHHVPQVEKDLSFL